MASTTLELIIKASADSVIQTVNQSVAAFTKMGGAVQKIKGTMNAFNTAAQNGGRAMNALRNNIVQLVGAYSAIDVLKSSVKIMQDAELASQNMTISIQAANREFEGTGSVDQWNDAIKRIQKETVVYSESALKGAVSRTVDMTKRLGLSAEQMEEVIKRTADLSAGKVDLEGGIERVFDRNLLWSGVNINPGLLCVKGNVGARYRQAGPDKK